MNVLHITAWYPNASNPFEAIWIKRLVEALPNRKCHKVYHITVTIGKQFSVHRSNEHGVHHCVWYVPTRRWIIIEVLNFLLLLYYLGIKRIHGDFNVINFHIAYPQLVYWHLLRCIVKKPVIISEHWSAYHQNFGVQKKLPRVQRIFRHDLPLLTVSRSLLQDIETFSGYIPSVSFVVPNAIDTNIFKCAKLKNAERTFFMVSQWQAPKRPDVVIRAFARLKDAEVNRHFKLRIGGYGPQLLEMKALTDSLGLSDSVSFLGEMNSTEIALEMNRCCAFLHCSDYETFSVVCAESICCGTPVIASDVGGIREFINDTNGKLVKANSVSEWFTVMREFPHVRFDAERISQDATEMFSSTRVGIRYHETLERVSRVKG